MDVERRAELCELHASFCQALADPHRLLIVEELRGGPRTVSELVVAVESTQSNVSRHLAVLRERGVVRATRDGPNVVYHLNDSRVTEALDLLRATVRDHLRHQSELALTAGRENGS